MAVTQERRTKYGFDDLTIAMATYNEQEAIESVLTDIDQATNSKASVVCVDGSTDHTPEIAREHGAQVIRQEPRGYGVAVERALREASTPVVLTTDCDDTYPMERIPDFLEHINQGYDVVSGDRITRGAETMPRLNRFGNKAFAAIASLLTGTRVRDTTTGMRMYRREVIRDIEWTENTGLSAELLLRPLIRGYRVTEVGIDYRNRLGETKLDPFRGGAAIAKSIVKVCLQEHLRRR